VKPASIWRLATSSLATAVLISACAGGSGFIGGSGQQSVVNGNLRGVADCTFGKIRMAQPTGLTQSVVPGEQKILITFNSGSTQHWEMTFTPSGGATNVSISAGLSSGPYPADRAAQTARSCAAR
jgi:hypothetical protein